jgi:hypothetical protein
MVVGQESDGGVFAAVALFVSHYPDTDPAFDAAPRMLVLAVIFS